MITVSRIFKRPGVVGTRVSDPDPVSKFLWIRIRFSNISGSGSGFQILWIRIRFQPPDPGEKIECRKGSKSYILEDLINIRPDPKH